MAPATRISPPLNRPFNHRSSLPPASKNFLFLGNPTPSSTIVAVRCQVPFSEGGSSTNHASSVSSSIDFLTLCHRLKVYVCEKKLYRFPKIQSYALLILELPCCCCVDNEEKRMDQSGDQWSWIDCWSHVPYVSNGAHCWWSYWSWQRKVSACFWDDIGRLLFRLLLCLRLSSKSVWFLSVCVWRVYLRRDLERVDEDGSEWDLYYRLLIC